MPGKTSGHVMKLYLAKSLKELTDKLESHANITKHPPEQLQRTANKLYEQAEEKLQKGDEEHAYVSYMRFFHAISIIQKKHKVEQEIVKKAKISLETAEKLKLSLKNRYELMDMARKKEEEEEEEMRNSPIASSCTIEDEQHLDYYEETPAAPKGKVDAYELHEMINKYRGTKNLLIIDIRLIPEYLHCHIDVPCIINIPEDIISLGFTAKKLENTIPKESLQLWNHRSEAEYIVLLDWSSKLENVVANSSKLYALRVTLEKWDIGTHYKNLPVILEGGYDEWLLHYPNINTLPGYQRTINNEADDMDDIANSLNDVDFPMDFLNNSPNLTATVNDYTKPNFDRGLKPIPTVMINKSKSISNNVFDAVIPNVDRTSKQLALKRMNEEQEKADTLKEQMNGKQREMKLLREKAIAQADAEMNEIKVQALSSEVDVLQKQLLEQEKIVKELQKKVAESGNIEKAKDIESSPVKTKSDIPEPTVIKPQVPTAPKPIYTTIINKPEKKNNLLGGKTILSENTVDNNVKIVPLAPDSPGTSSGLSRSHSTPNINNLDDNTPVYDRTKKPTIRKINSTRDRDFSPVYGSRGPGLTGLKNLGNSCYMNSIIQCISNTSPLSEYFFNDYYRNDVCTTTRTRGQIAEELATLIRALWCGEFRSVACKDFKKVAGIYHSDFAGYRQQDSHEFLTLLIDWLHDDLNKKRNKKPPSLNTTTNIEEEIRKSRYTLDASNQAWNEFKLYNDSRILNLFYGQQSSTITCSSCRFQSITFEPFSSLTLVLPKDKQEKCSLLNCLELYLAPEMISEWKCPQCKRANAASKKFDIWILPPILVIHFKRFYEDVLWRKRHTLVEFPRSNFSMEQFIKSSQPHYLYDLYAVSNHYGTMDGGHYTTYSLNNKNKKWYKFDDADVSEISQSNVHSNAAYILFYASVN